MSTEQTPPRITLFRTRLPADRYGLAPLEVEAPDLRTALIRLADEHADLTGVGLSGLDGEQLELTCARLWYADLSYARLSGADLENADLRDALLYRANLSGAMLAGADLRGADLAQAQLHNAELSGAKFDARTILPTGEPFGVYCDEVVPQLLTAGGRALEDVVGNGGWACHSWSNCPMARAFMTHDLAQIPRLHRPRAEQFIQLFDARLIPNPLDAPADA